VQPLRHATILAVTAVVTLAGPVASQAQETKYPARKVDFVVGFAAGGFADTVARFVAQKLNDKWGQSVIIENRGGAGGNLAARSVRSAEPDGHTVLVTTTAMAINPTMYRRLEFSLDDLVAVAIPAASPETLAAHPSKASAGLKEFLAANEGKEVTFGTAGAGSGSHLAAEYFFKERTKTKALHVPFRGGSPAVQAVLGNQIDLIVSSFGVNAQVAEGKLKGLAVASPSRNPALPDVPTFKESGFDFEAESWVGFLVPAKTSQAVIERLNTWINEVMSDPASREHLTKLGLRLSPRNAAESQAYLKAEVAKWATMVKSVGVYVD
jgi:tripartite-type tricarboxylate transporter receptor subunit TctC